MKKRALATVLSLALACTLLPTAAAVTVTEMVPLKYDAVHSFSEGLAAVRLDGKYGYIDKTGKEVVPCKYDYAEPFHEGLAEVRLDNKYGYVDKTGKEVVPCMYGIVDNFSDGLAAVSLDGKHGYIDKTGKEVIPRRYEWARNFSEGLAAVELDSGEKDKWGYAVNKCGFIDITGKEVVPCKYDAVGNFSEDFARVCVGKFPNEEKWGFIDKTGQEVIPCKYNSAISFFDGLAAVNIGCDRYGNGGKWGFVDKVGKEIVPCMYDTVDNFSEGLAVVCVGEYPDGKCGFIDKTGQEVVPCKYEWVGNISDGVAVVQLDGKWGIISICAANTAYASTQNVLVDGVPVEFQCYALKDENGNDTNYIKLRDLAILLNGTAAQFQVSWDGSVTITTGTAYTPNGSEMKTPYSGDRAYETAGAVTNVNGAAASLNAIVLKDDDGGAYTYYKLRDLGAALGFQVDWTAERGIFIETK